MSSQTRIYSYESNLMGSPILLKLFSSDKTLAARTFALIKHYENLLTVNKLHSEVMSINHAAGRHPVSVSQQVYQLIKCAKAASTVQGSIFNLAIGPLVKLWRIGFGKHSAPTAHEIVKHLPLTKPQNVVMDDAKQSVFLTCSGMEIDLGAIAKGYIADQVRNYLQQQGMQSALINLGGNVHTLGKWSIGIKKPFSNREDLLGRIEISSQSVVTTGIYERYFEQDGKRWHHILNPLNGYPLDNNLESVTIISDTSLDGDIWSTLLYGLGVDESLSVLHKRKDIEAIFVTKNREILLSSQHRFRFFQLDESYHLTNCEPLKQSTQAAALA